MAYQAPNSSSKRPATSASMLNAGGGWFKSLLTLIVIAIIVGGGIYMLKGSIKDSSMNFNNEYQAVFLDNGQVYFGKITKMNDEVVELVDIYYLQVINQPLQRSQNTTATTDQETEQRLTLIKLGNELHGPEDLMSINKDHVVLIEDLREDSRVVQAIHDSANKETGQAVQPVNPTTQVQPTVTAPQAPTENEEEVDQ